MNACTGGGEAVDFFQRSGLAKEPLFQVWRVILWAQHDLDKCGVVLGLGQA